MFRPDFQAFCARTILVDQNRFIAVFIEIKEATSLTRRGARRRQGFEGHAVVLHSRVGRREKGEAETCGCENGAPVDNRQRRLRFYKLVVKAHDEFV
jgi:hypothetical protein